MLKLKNAFFIFSLTGIFLALVSSCSNKKGTDKSNGKKIESTTSGEITVAMDESLKPVLDQELNVFDSSFPEIKIHRQYLSESACFDRLFKDSARLIMVTRDLTKEEKRISTANGIITRSLAVAEDAIAIIVNTGSQDSLMTVGQLKSILTGKFAREYTIVFDNPNSGIVNYVSDSLIPGEKLSSKTYAVENNEAVIKYVSENKNALGILGVSHVYDPEDNSGAGVFRKNIKVVSFRNDSTGVFYQPYQAYIAFREYPFTRSIYFISRENWPGPASGFANFLSSERGQLIFNKARLLPLRVQLTIREAAIKK